MKPENRQRKNDIKYLITLNEEQKEAKRLILENQIVIITGQAGSGKSLVCAQTALGFLQKGMVEKIFNTRAAIELGKTLGFLPGGLNDKFDPYNGLKYAIDLSKHISEIKWIKLKENHRSGLVGKILDFEYNKK